MRANREFFRRFAYTGQGEKNYLTKCSHLLEGDRLGNAGRDNAGVQAEGKDISGSQFLGKGDGEEDVCCFTLAIGFPFVVDGPVLAFL